MLSNPTDTQKWLIFNALVHGKMIQKLSRNGISDCVGGNHNLVANSNAGLSGFSGIAILGYGNTGTRH